MIVLNANCANYAHFTFEFYQINLCNSRNSRSKQIRPPVGAMLCLAPAISDRLNLSE